MNAPAFIAWAGQQLRPWLRWADRTAFAAKCRTWARDPFPVADDDGRRTTRASLIYARRLASRQHRSTRAIERKLRAATTRALRASVEGR